MEKVKDTGSVDARVAWEKMRKRLQDEDLIPEQGVNAKRRLGYTLIRIAAVAVILLGIGAVVYLNLNHKPPVSMVRLNTSNEANTLIKTLDDGSVIYIAQNSQFSFPARFNSSSRNVELKGEAFFDITPDPDKPFIIETGEALIRVLGTAFNVKTGNGNGFELFVDRGKVTVSLKKDPSRSETVVAGEMISGVSNSLVRSKVVSTGASSWYTQRMRFKDEKLLNIITVLNRNFNTNFVLADNEIGQHKLTVTFQEETAGTMTELICMALNLKSQTINGSVVLSEIKGSAKQN